MPKILFVPMSWGRGMGPLIDCLSVAKEASRIGYDIGFLVRERFTPLVLESAYPVFLNVSPPAPKRIESVNFDIDFPFFQGLGDEYWVRKTLECEDRAIESFKPDIIFSWLQYTAYISSKRTGIPLASVARWTGHPNFTSPLLPNKKFPVSKCTPVFNKILNEYNLDGINDIWELDFVRSDLKIVPGIPELEPHLLSEKDLCYVGHLLSMPKINNSDIIKSKNKSRPLILVYLSAKQFQPDYYLPIIKEAFSKSGFRVVVLVGLQDIASQLPANDTNIQYLNWVPMEEMLSVSDIVISSGTRGTAWQAAIQGAVNIAFPGSDPERYFVAKMVESAKAGILMPDKSFNPVELRSAAEHVIKSDLRQYAIDLGRKIVSYGGPYKAARLLSKISR